MTAQEERAVNEPANVGSLASDGDATPLAEDGASTGVPIVDYCDALIGEFARKADHNKMESQACFVATIGATLLTPLSVTLGQDMLLGKIVPSALSALAAGATAWIQLRKPQQLWALYRTTQRELEDHKTRFRYGIAPYGTTGGEKEFIKNVADIAIGVHRQWLPLVPDLGRLQLPDASSKAAVPKATGSKAGGSR